MQHFGFLIIVSFWLRQNWLNVLKRTEPRTDQSILIWIHYSTIEFVYSMKLNLQSLIGKIRNKLRLIIYFIWIEGSKVLFTKALWIRQYYLPSVLWKLKLKELNNLSKIMIYRCRPGNETFWCTGNFPIHNSSYYFFPPRVGTSI